MKQFKQFEITTSPLNSDLISGLLWELDISGINEENEKIIVFANSDGSVNKSLICDQLEKDHQFQVPTMGQVELEFYLK